MNTHRSYSKLIVAALLALSAALLFVFVNNDHNDLGTLTKMVGAPSFKMALNLNNRNLGKKKIKKNKKNGKNHKSKSKNNKKKNIFDHGDDDDNVCDMKNFVSTTTYEGGGDCDKAFQVTIQCNDQGDLCTFEEESVSVGVQV